MTDKEFIDQAMSAANSAAAALESARRNNFAAAATLATTKAASSDGNWASAFDHARATANYAALASGEANIASYAVNHASKTRSDAHRNGCDIKTMRKIFALVTHATVSATATAAQALTAAQAAQAAAYYSDPSNNLA